MVGRPVRDLEREGEGGVRIDFAVITRNWVFGFGFGSCLTEHMVGRVLGDDQSSSPTATRGKEGDRPGADLLNLAVCSELLEAGEKVLDPAIQLLRARA